MNQHNKFIFSPLSDILAESFSALECIGNGIETYPLYDYIMQSTFIKMSGAQEQKIKIIIWELANNDFDYRYALLSKNSHRNYSSYKEKQEAYCELVSQIEINDSSKFKVCNISVDKKKILESTYLHSIFNIDILSSDRNKYEKYEEFWKKINTNHFLQENSKLFSCNKLESLYKEHLYKNRNRIAHNTKCYQHNLPTFNVLQSENYDNENYFIWFSVLILIDHIFMELYKVYLENLEIKKFFKRL